MKIIIWDKPLYKEYRKRRIPFEMGICPGFGYRMEMDGFSLLINIVTGRRGTEDVCGIRIKEFPWQGMEKGSVCLDVSGFNSKTRIATCQG